MYFLTGTLLVLVTLLTAFAVKKFGLLEPRANTTITYKTAAGQQLKLHAFFAAGSKTDTPKPALLFFHGGRWLYGHPRALYPQCQFFARQGFHCFSAQYRLGQNDRVDVRELVTDASDAFAYLLNNAGTLNIDTARIAVGGGSSGGHLAAALGTLARNAADIRPAALVLFNPMLDLAPGTPDYPLVQDYWEAVSPQHHISAGMPPAIILVGSEDPEVPVATAEAFCAAAQAAGSRCDLEVYEGQGHGFFNHAPFLEQTNQRVLRFLHSL